MNSIDLLKQDKSVKSIYPLVYWLKNEYISEYLPQLYILGGRGSAFLFKTEKYHYLITVRHNFDNADTDSIVKQMQMCFLHRDFASLNDVRYTDFNHATLIKLEYLPITLDESYNDLCIFRIINNLPNDAYFLTYDFPDFSTEDNGYIVGYPQQYKNLTGETYNCQRAILQVEFNGITRADTNFLYTYHPGVNFDLNGFSGAPVLQYNTDSENFIFMGVVITGGNGLVRVIPSNVVIDVLNEWEDIYMNK